jgi:hypothetical protein
MSLVWRYRYESRPKIGGGDYKGAIFSLKIEHLLPMTMILIYVTILGSQISRPSAFGLGFYGGKNLFRPNPFQFLP